MNKLILRNIIGIYNNTFSMKPNTNNKSPCQKALAPTNKGATFKDMITLRAVTREGATFGDDMITFRAEFIGGGAKLFLSRRLF